MSDYTYPPLHQFIKGGDGKFLINGKLVDPPAHWPAGLSNGFETLSQYNSFVIHVFSHVYREQAVKDPIQAMKEAREATDAVFSPWPNGDSPKLHAPTDEEKAEYAADIEERRK